MLPHILHSTTRAVVAVQNQTHTIRNVLQLQSSSGPSSGSGPSWGNGPGPGGSKYNAGSRFYSGFNSAGRAVTQANVVSSHDGSFVQSDDSDDVVGVVSRRPGLQSSPKRLRIRSSSLSNSGGLSGRVGREETSGVFQIYARAKHAFAPVENLSSSIADSPLPLVRRNSTSFHPTSHVDAPPPLPPPPIPLPTASLEAESQPSPNKPLSQDSSSSPEPNMTDASIPLPSSPLFDYYIDKFKTLAWTDDYATTKQTLSLMLQNIPKPTVDQFNAALNALMETRERGQPVTDIINAYKDMLALSITPNVLTYEILIVAFATRDVEIDITIALHSKNKKFENHLNPGSTAKSNTDVVVDQLRKEDNFAPAMALFESVLAMGAVKELSMRTFTNLLASCSVRADVNSALQVFSQLEIRNIKPHVKAYLHMLRTFSKARRIGEAEIIFQEFLQKAKSNKVWLNNIGPNAAEINRMNQVKVWNAMIEAYFRADQPEKAIGLLDKMLQSSAGENYQIADVPTVTSSTFSTIIYGFISNGDLPTALSWFERLLQESFPPERAYQGLGGKVMRPDTAAWIHILNALVLEDRFDDFNRLYMASRSFRKEDGIALPYRFVTYFFDATMKKLPELDNDEALKRLDFLLMSSFDIPVDQTRLEQQIEICEQLIKRGQISAVDHIVKGVSNALLRDGTSILPQKLLWLQKLASKFAYLVHHSVKQNDNLTLRSALAMSRLMFNLSVDHNLHLPPSLLHCYGKARSLSQESFEDLTKDDWSNLLSSAISWELNKSARIINVVDDIPNFAFSGIVPLLEHMASLDVDFGAFDGELKKETIRLLRRMYDEDTLSSILSNLGPAFVEAANQLKEAEERIFAKLERFSSDSERSQNDISTPDKSVSDTKAKTLTIDATLSENILGVLRDPRRPNKDHLLYKLFDNGLKRRIIPNTEALGSLLSFFGRLKDMEKVKHIYDVSQRALDMVKPLWKLASWIQIEDSMILAMAHSGNLDTAHLHRARILKQGGAPSADSYGVLISHVNTMDDVSGALQLFSEALEHGIQPNIFLYNNIISKLSKGRKADYAIELFRQMQSNSINPNSVTYGAVIAACVRVGDVSSAHVLFEEMTKTTRIKPRVPVYNTMMQLYTTTKPNRDMVLYFYDEMQKVGVKPSSHTYKLLLDAYGAIEPVDLKNMERVFLDIMEDPTVELSGHHFASLINSYGCVQKDLDKALGIFESIGNYPGARPADAVVYEALVNAIVANKRTDLLGVYINDMFKAGVHMTAYIANFLIKGYANVGDMEKAREVFESLKDAEIGQAAPNNHASHDPSSPEVPITEPVYREPSTWETMVRAELGSGNRDAAFVLLERLKERQYPEAVYNRISGILIDHTMPL